MKPKRKWIGFFIIPAAFISFATVACEPINNSNNDGDKNPGGGDQNGGSDNPGGGDNTGGGDNPGGGDNTGGGDKPVEDKDELIDEIQKLTYTSLNEAEFKALTITEGTSLDENVAEQLGFVLPTEIKALVNTATPKYTATISKAQDDTKVIYKYKKSSWEEEKTQEVTVTPFIGDELTQVLDNLKQYKVTAKTHEDWQKVYANGLRVAIDSYEQNKNFQIKGLTDFAKTLDGKHLVAYIRKAKDEETLKYVAVKTLGTGGKVIRIGELITISVTDLDTEIPKLIYTGLNEAELKALTITDGTVLDESVAEQLGFILPDLVKKYIKTSDNNNPKYEVKVSKAKDDLKVTYKFRKTTEAEDKAVTAEVPMTPNNDNGLTAKLNDLKKYNKTSLTHSKWVGAYANEFEITIDSDKQTRFLKIDGLVDYAKTLKDTPFVAYVRKTKGEETIKYIVVQTLDSGAKILKTSDPITVITTNPAVSAIKTKLKALMTDEDNPLTSTAAEDDFKKEQQARIQIIPDGGTPYDWSQIRINTPAADQLPAEDMLQDAAATDKGKIEIEKKVGETTLHWYITYVDENNTSITDEYVAEVTLATSTFPTVAEAQAKDWTAAKVLNPGNKPSGIDGGAFKNKPVLTRITLEDDTVFYLYTNKDDGGVVQSKKYSGIRLDDKKQYLVASNANDFKEVRILQTDKTNPPYSNFKIHPKEVKYMYL